MLLLTLLPFTAWAQYLEFDEATYDGTSHAFPTVYLDQFHMTPIPVSTSTYATSGSYRYRVDHWRKSGSNTNLSQYQNAGSYVANIQRRSTSSGAQWGDWQTVTLTVNKTTITPTLTPNAAVYNGEQNDLPGVQVGGSTVFDGLDDGFDGTWKVEWKAGSSSVSSWKNKGTYTVTVSNTNQEGTANFVVGKGTNYFTAEPTMAGWTFDPACYTAPKAEPAGAAAKWGTVEFEYSDDNSTWTDYATAVGGMANTTGTKYYVRAFVKPDADGNYDRVESTVQEFVISKATFSKEGWDAIFTNPTANSGLEWDGTSKALITEGVVKDAKAFTGATISYAYSPDGGTSWSGGYNATPAGDYQVKYTIAGARNFDNYVSNDNVIEASIAQATNSVTAPTVLDITYGATPTPSSTATYGAIKYVYQKVGSEDPYTETITKFTAGDWNVKAVVAETNNYAGAESNPVTFNVAKAQFTVNSTLAAKLSMIYNGGEQSLLTGTIKKTTGMPDGIVTYTIGEETFGPIHSSDPGLVKKTNAGEYEVNWSVTAQDEEEAKNWLPATGTITAEIAQATLNLGLTPLTVDYGTAVTAEKIFTDVITSDEWVASESATDKMTILLEALNITTSKDGGAAEAGFTPILEGNAGGYDIALAKKSDPTPGNYNVKLYSNGTTITINKINATLAVLTPETPVYDGDAKALVTVTTPAVGGDVMYFVGDAAPEVESTDWQAAIPEETTAGTYKVWQKVAGDENHKDVVATAAVEVTIDQSTAQVFTWTQTEGFAYGAPAVLPVATALENAAITYKYRKDGESLYVPAESVAEWTAGKWFVKATAAETANYEEVVSADQEFTVSQATNAITDFAIVGWTYGEYDDVANAPKASATFGVPTFTYSDSETGTFTAEVPVNAGTWYVKASVAATDDYDAAEQVFSFKIEKAQVTDIVAPAPAKKDLIYNAADQALVTAAKFDDGIVKGTFEYSLSETGTYTADIPTGFDAGDYTVFTKFIPDNNHEGTTVPSVAVTVAPLTVTYSLTTIDNWEYNGEEVKDVPAALYSLTNPLELPGDDKFTAPFTLIFPKDVTVKDAKDYDFHKLEVKWTKEDKQNYAPKFLGNGKFTITPKPLAEGMITLDPENAVFSGDNITVGVTVEDIVGEQNILAFGGENADVTYEITKDGATVKNGEIKNEGTYNFVFTAANNYKGEITVPFKVGGMSIDDMLTTTKGNWDDVVYDGTSQAPEFKLSYMKGDKEVVLQKGTDYEVYIWKPIKPNTGLGVDPKDVKDVAFEGKAYTFSIEAKGNYSGKIEKFKKILPKALKAEDVRTMAESAEYTSKGQMPEYKLASNLKGDLLTNLNEGADFYVNIDGVDKTDETKLTDAATYKFKFIGKNNYTGAIDRDFIITPATVLVQAGSYEKFYNGKVGAEGAEVVDGDVDWTYSGLKGDDGFDAKSVVVADGALIVEKASENVGIYQLAVDTEKFSVNSNYTFVAADKQYQGKLEIKKAPVTLGFENEKDKKPFYSVSKVYGQDDKTVDFLDKVKVLKNEEDSPIASELNKLATKTVNIETGEKAMTFKRATAGTEEVGTYDNDVQISFNAGVFSNYDVTTTPGNFEITEAPLTVALKNDIEVVYDGAYPAEELANIDASQLAISGLKWTDDYSALKNVKGTIVDDKGKTIEPKDVGTYILKLEAEADDYTVTTLDSRLIITPAPLTVSIADQTVYVGAEDEDLDMGAATIKGIIGNDAVEAKMVLNASTASPDTFEEGVKLTIGNTNYQIVEQEGQFEVVKQFSTGKLIVLAKEDIALDDTKAYTLPEKETTADVTFTTRVVNEDTWNVCVLPFETSPAEISDAFGYAAVDVLDDTRDDGNIHFQIVTSGVIPAGTPFIFKPSKDADDAVADFDEVTFESVKIVKSFAAPVTVENGNTYVTDKAGNKFWGTFKSTSFYGKQYWYMTKGAWKDASKFTDAKPVTVKPFRAFVEFVTPAAGRIFIEEPDGTETAIDAIQFNQMVNGEATYTLDGKKVNNVTQKGIYIKDGKKVAVK